MEFEPQRVDDGHEPQRVPEPRSGSLIERVAVAICAVAVAAAAVWFTALSVLGLGAAVECSGSGEGSDLAGAVIGVAMLTALVTLTWMAVFALVCAVFGRRAPSKSTWLLLPATLAAFSIGPVVVIVDRRPARPPVAVDPSADPFQSTCNVRVYDKSERWPYR